ncbi:MAG: hypothetical protein IJK63_12565, partial [Oscillospiraceae bacterium]|nr:hypothetical protein [Oscillospiraceae bacterium]
SETDRKYGKYCHTIAYNICANNEDAEECVNDTWFSAWNMMPDKRPSIMIPTLMARHRVKRPAISMEGGTKLFLRSGSPRRRLTLAFEKPRTLRSALHESADFVFLRRNVSHRETHFSCPSLPY